MDTSAANGPEGRPEEEPVGGRDEWMRRAGPLYPALVALRQLTPLPIMRNVEPTIDDVNRAAPWFPAVGGLLGGLLALIVLIVLEIGMVPAIGAALVVGLTVIASGALHESGFARTVEDFAGATDEPSAYSRQPLGVYGLMAILALIAGRGLLLLGIHPGEWIAAILISQIVLRWTPIFLLRLGDRVGELVPGERSLLVGELSWLSLAIGSGFALLVAILFGGLAGFGALLIAAVVAFGLGVLLQRRYGGLTANGLAAASVLCELAVLVVFAITDPAIVSPWVS